MISTGRIIQQIVVVVNKPAWGCIPLSKWVIYPPDIYEESPITYGMGYIWIINNLLSGMHIQAVIVSPLHRVIPFIDGL